MTVLAVASGKGGVGKSTTCLTLGALLAESGQRVLIGDCDAQGSASAWLGVSAVGDVTLMDVLAGRAALRDIVRRSPAFELDVIPSHPTLAAAERALAGQPLAALGLRKALADSGGRWDWVLLDCPPGLSLMTSAAVAASTAVLATAEPTGLGLHGLGDLLGFVDGIAAHVSPAPFVAAVLACRVPSRQRLAAAMLDVLRERWPDLMMTTTIREAAAAREAAAVRQPLTRYAPGSHVLADYRQALGELEERLKHHGGSN